MGSLVSYSRAYGLLFFKQSTESRTMWLILPAIGFLTEDCWLPIILHKSAPIRPMAYVSTNYTDLFGLSHRSELILTVILSTLYSGVIISVAQITFVKHFSSEWRSLRWAVWLKGRVVWSVGLVPIPVTWSDICSCNRSCITWRILALFRNTFIQRINILVKTSTRL